MHKKILSHLSLLPKSLYIAIALAIGITSANLGAQLELFFIIGLFLTYVFKKSQTRLAVGLLFTCLILGGALYNIQVNRFLAFEDKFCTKAVDITGTVVESKINNSRAYKNQILLKLNTVKLGCNILNENGIIQIACLNDTYLKNGQKIEIKNIILTASDDSDYKSYLMRSNILNSTFISGIKYKRLKGSTTKIQISMLRSIKDRLDISLRSKLNGDTLMFYNSIFMGDKQELSQEKPIYVNNFSQWGIAHILARSGLHLSILIFLFEVIFKIGFITFWLQRLIGLCFMLIFYAISTPASPFIRAFYMYMLHDGCAISKLPVNTLHLFCITSIIMLLCNPIEILFLDFQLSFGVTLILLLWAYKFDSKK